MVEIMTVLHKSEIRKNVKNKKKIIKETKEIEQINTKQDATSKKKKKKLMNKGLTQLGKDYKVKFNFRNASKLDGKIIDVKQISFGYPGEEDLFEDVELNIDLNSKIGLVGPNGVGKSTLVNLIIGELQVTEGEILRNRKLSIVKFSQHFVDQLTLTDNPIEYIQKLYPHIDQPQEVRNRLGMFGLPGAMHTQPISLLSGGQKSRVIFASLSFKNPHIYFLDEPTNHLDIESVDALATALSNFDGGVIIISHDQRLISTVCNEIWVCRGDKNVEIYEGTFEDYRKEIIDRMDYALLDEEQALNK